MKKAIATIETDNGTMTIYFNGSNEYLTAEARNVIEPDDYLIEVIEDAKPDSVDRAVDLVLKLYSSTVWNLSIIGE